MKVKVGDNVLVIAGKDKGKTGQVQRVLKNADKVVIEKVNIMTRHVKKTPQRPGERIKYEAAIDISNIMVACPGCNKRTRVGYSIPKDGKKYRICKKCNASLDKEKTTKKQKK